MALRSKRSVAFACVATAVLGMNVRKLEVHDSDLCKDSEQHCCNWNNKTERVGSVSEAPMVLFSGGCAGSSAVLIMVRDIAELSIHPVLDCGGGYELLADIDSGFYGDKHTVLPAAVRAFNKRAVDMNRSLLFKAEDRFLNHPQTMDLLRELDARFAVLKRWNKIDVALCAVHDCFTDGFTPAPFGYKVDETGHKDEDCRFRGRGSNESSTNDKVHVDTDHLLENLRYLTVTVDDNNMDFLAQSGVAFQRLSYEDLFAFHDGTADELVSSSVAWTGFMRGLGVHTSFETVYAYLRQNREAFERPKKHSETIVNFDTVKRVLTTCEAPDCKQMLNMLRE